LPAGAGPRRPGFPGGAPAALLGFALSLLLSLSLLSLSPTLSLSLYLSQVLNSEQACLQGKEGKARQAMKANLLTIVGQRICAKALGHLAFLPFAFSVPLAGKLSLLAYLSVEPASEDDRWMWTTAHCL
jgi:hypothetical protein